MMMTGNAQSIHQRVKLSKVTHIIKQTQETLKITMPSSHR